MKKFFKEKNYAKWGLTALVVIVIAIVFNYVLKEWNYMKVTADTAVQILRPILLGAAFAYILNPLLKTYEKYIFKKLYEKLFKTKADLAHKFMRATSIFFTFVTAIAIVAGLILLILPELCNNILHMVESIPMYSENVVKYLTKLSKDYPNETAIAMEYMQDILNNVSEWATETLLPNASVLITNVSMGIYGAFKAVLDVVVGLIVAVYLLASKEKYSAGAKKFMYAIFKKETAYNIVSLARYADNHFGRFFVGKILDSAIIGVLSFIVFSIFDIPYTLLISVFVGVTNVIPFFGPFLGAIPSALLILLEDPVKAVVFSLLILAIQQLDGNIIGPKILGDTTGLDSFAIVFSILVFGGVFGILGMFIGVPVFATIWGVVNHLCNKKLENKNMPTNLEAYSSNQMVTETVKTETPEE